MFVDLKHSARALLRSPEFTLPAVLALAVGLGATTAVFTLVNAIVMRPLRYPAADRLVVIGHVAPRLQAGALGQSDGTYLYYRENNHVFEDLGVYYENVVNLTDVDEPERIHVAMMSATIYSTLGVRPVVGRLFSAEDDRGEVPVLISHDLWRRRFGSDPAITQRTIGLNNGPRRVIGVLPAGFDFPRRETDVWYPDEPRAAKADVTSFTYTSVARLRTGVTVDDAQAHLNQLLSRMTRAHPNATALVEGGMRATVTPLQDVVVGPIRSALWLLLASMGVVLLIACANVANLMLVRAEHRRREIAVRLALGARASDLARLFNSESLLLVLGGGVLGLLAAQIGVRLLVLAGPANIPRLHEVRFDLRVYGFLMLLSLLMAIAFGLAPLMRRKATNLPAMLKSGGHGSTADRERQRVRATLVIAQVALALTLLIASGLLVQSFVRLKNAEPGFDANRVLNIDLSLPYRGYESYDRNFAFWEQLLARVRSLPGVASAGAGGALPLIELPAYMDQSIVTDATASLPGNAQPKGTIGLVTEGYFEALRIPLLAGSYPTTGADASVLLSGALARRLFPNEDAIGKRVRRAGSEQWNIVGGVVGDVPRSAIGGQPAEIFYVPVMKVPVDSGFWPGYMTLTVRTSAEPGAIVPAIRAIVRELDRNLPLSKVRTMEDIVSDSMARTSLAMVLLLVAGAAALLLGVVGLYAVISYTVTRRTRELGIRIAVGAREPDLLRLVVGQAVTYITAGVVAGLTVSLIAMHWLRGLLFGISPTDPLTIAAMVALMFMAAIASSMLPAKRAARIDPIRALKAE